MLLPDLAAGLAAVHLVWLLAYLLGILTLESLNPKGPAARNHGIDRRLDFIFATATGITIIILGLFALGSARALSPGACTALFLALLVGLGAYARPRLASAGGMVSVVLEPLVIFRSRAALAIYVIALLEAAPAVLPPVQWDSTMYHLANAVNWAHHDRIYADPFLRAPYFAFNVELFYASAFVYHLGQYVLFWGWLPFVGSALGIQVSATWLISRYLLVDDRARAANAFGFAAAVAFLISPLVLRYAVTGYVDVMSGFLFLAAAVAMLRSLGDFRRYAFVAAIVGGVFIGTKLQLVLFGPLFIIGLLLAARRSSTGVRVALAPALAFIACAAPWFARNLITTGDPISPVLNMFLGHTDPIFSRADYAGMQWNLHYGGGSIFDGAVDFILGRPFLDEAGTSLSAAFIPLIPAASILLILFRRRWHIAPELSFLALFTAYAIFAIAAVSVHTERYILAYFALYIVTLTAFVTLLFSRLASFPRLRYGRRGAVAASMVALAVLALPEPIAGSAYESYTSAYNAIDGAEERPDSYLAAAGGSDYEARDIARLVASSHVPGNVLAPGFENAAYYFRAQDVVSIGDWFGPGRYSDLQLAVQKHEVAAYLQRFRVNAVIFGPRNIGWSDNERRDFVQAITAAGFLDVSFVGDVIREYLRPDVAEAADVRLLAAAPRTPSRYLASMQIDFGNDFAAGAMSSSAKVPTPTGTGVFTYTWPWNGATARTITVLAGFSLRFSGIRLRHAPVLSVDVGKPLTDGKADVAWIDISSGGRTRRLFERSCEPRTAGIAWHHVEVALPDADGTATLTFGASSEQGGGIGDWVAFANARLLNASLLPAAL